MGFDYHFLPFPCSKSDFHSRSRIKLWQFLFSWDFCEKNWNWGFPFPMQTSTNRTGYDLVHTKIIYLRSRKLSASEFYADTIGLREKSMSWGR